MILVGPYQFFMELFFQLSNEFHLSKLQPGNSNLVRLLFGTEEAKRYGTYPITTGELKRSCYLTYSQMEHRSDHETVILGQKN